MKATGTKSRPISKNGPRPNSATASALIARSNIFPKTTFIPNLNRSMKAPASSLSPKTAIAVFRRSGVLALFLAFLLFSSSACRDVSKSGLFEDIDAYRDFVDQIHTDPYRLITPAEFADQVANIKREVQSLQYERLSTVDCFFYMQKLAAGIQDGHTRIRFPLAQLAKNQPVFPLRLKVLNGTFYVVENLGDNEIPAYCALIAINDIPIQTLFKKCLPLFPAALEQDKSFWFEEYFHSLITLYLKIEPPWQVRYKTGPQEGESDLRAISQLEYFRTMQKLGSRYRFYSIDIGGTEVPVLELPNFSYGDADTYKQFVDRFFYKYQESPYLIIDVRQNRGGSGYWGFYLLDYLNEADYRIAEQFKFRVSDKMRNSIYAYKAGDRLKTAKTGDYVHAIGHRMRTPHKKSSKFKGKTFLLISAKTFSAGTVFAAVFKANNMGLVLGQETSGRIQFCSDPITLTLPNSRLKVTIPLAIYTLPGDNPDRGVRPHIRVARTLETYQHNQDPELEKVKELIRSDLKKNQ